MRAIARSTAIPKTFEETTLDEMDRVLDINVRGTLVATQAALKHMKSGGRIIMIGSSPGGRGPGPGPGAPSAPKGGAEMVCPGGVSGVGSRGVTGTKLQPGAVARG